LAEIEDPATELTLARRCADVCKVTHLLRSSGDTIPQTAHTEFDKVLRSSLERILAGPIDWASWEQATASVANAGLGFRDASNTALPAFIASRIASRPFVLHLAHAFEAAHFVPPGTFAEAYDRRTATAVTAFKNCLSAASAASVESAIDQGNDRAQARFAQFGAANSGWHVDADRPGGNLVQAAGEEEPESGLAEGQDSEHGTPGLQRLLTSILDAERITSLSDQISNAARWSDVRRIRELRAASHQVGSSDWLWALNPAHSPILPPEVYTAAVQTRIGIPLHEDAIICGSCGEAIITPGAAHPLCCARAACNAGHNSVRDELHCFALTADPLAEVEPEGLIEDSFAPRASPRRRVNHRCHSW
jgi:hypothetical protein